MLLQPCRGKKINDAAVAKAGHCVRMSQPTLSDWVFCWVVADIVACMVSAAVLITFPAFRSLNHVFCYYVVTSKHLVELMPAQEAHVITM
jgi:hypothetical protein